MPRKRKGSKRQRRTAPKTAVTVRKAAVAPESARRTRDDRRRREKAIVPLSFPRQLDRATRAPYRMRKAIVPLELRRILAKKPNVPSVRQLVRRAVLDPCRKTKLDRRNMVLRSGGGSGTTRGKFLKRTCK